jgi:hypothetical protein
LAGNISAAHDPDPLMTSPFSSARSGRNGDQCDRLTDAAVDCNLASGSIQAMRKPTFIEHAQEA